MREKSASNPGREGRGFMGRGDSSSDFSLFYFFRTRSIGIGVGHIHRLDRLIYLDLGTGRSAPVFVSEDIHQNVMQKATI